jgi:hypothetical protein
MLTNADVSTVYRGLAVLLIAKPDINASIRQHTSAYVSIPVYRGLAVLLIAKPDINASARQEARDRIFKPALCREH